MTSNVVKKFSQDVVEHLFEQISVLWEEEGLEDSSMSDLRQLWESKLTENGIDLNRDGAGHDHHEPAPPKASGRGRAKAAQNAANVSSAAGRKAARSSPQLAAQQQQQQQQHDQEQQLQQPSLSVNLQERRDRQTTPDRNAKRPAHGQPYPLQAQPHHPQLASHTVTAHAYQTDQQQQHIVRQQQQQGAPPLLHSQQQVIRPTIQAGNQHGLNNIPGGVGVPTISLLPYSVPISGPIVHISSSSKVPDAGAQPGHNNNVRQHLSQNHQAAAANSINIHQLMDNAGNHMRMGNMAQIVNRQQPQQQQQQQQPMPQQRASMAPHISLEERNRLMDHMNQMFRGQQPNIVMANRMATQQDVAQKFRQQNGVMPGNQQFTGLQYPNGNNIFSMGNQFPFQQATSSQSSVIHVADSSGNQSAVLLPVMRPVNENGGHIVSGNPVNRGGVGVSPLRKPGQSLPVQLDGPDDDEDDDDIFQDLSDDDTVSSKATPRPVKKQKTGDRRAQSDRLEEEDLDSEDDDDNDDNTANVVDDVDNVVVCQYEKIGRTRNKWKLQLKSGMCTLNGKEYVFSKATGDAEF